MDERFLECGRINNSHGLAGEVKFEIWTEPQYAKKLRVLYDEKGNSYEVEKRRFQGEDRMILKLKGIDTVEQAATLRTTVLYFNRDDIKLPKGSYFYADLIGMTVKDADNGRVYGTLAEVLALPASMVYRINSEDGKDHLVPAVDEFVRLIDFEENVILLTPIEGMFDSEI